MKLKKITSLLVVGMLVMSLVGCGSSNDTTPAATEKETETATDTDTDKAEESQDKPVITMTYRDSGSPEYINWFEAAYESYDKKDEFELNIQPIIASEGDYFAKVALALQSKDTAPNIVAEDTFQLASDVAAGYLTDMTPLLEDFTEWSDGTISEALISGLTYGDGAVYTVPFNTDTRGLWYNKDIFEEVGLDREWQPKTWQDILDTCAVIKEKAPDVVPFWMNSGVATGEATSMQTYEMLLYGTGEQLLDENDQWIVSSDNIKKSLGFIDDIYSNGYGPALAQVLNGEASNLSAREYLPNGKLAISLDGFWIAGNYKEGGAAEWPEYSEVLGFAAMPTSEGQGDGVVTMSGGWGLSIPELSENKQISADFIQHLMSYDIYLDYIVAAGNVSTRTDISADPLYMEQPYMAESTELLSGAYYRPRNSQYTAVTTFIQSMVEAVVTGTSPEDAVEQYKVDVTSTVGEENVVEK